MLVPMISTQPPALSMPVDCVIGESCFIQNYVDLDQAEGAWHDYRCGPNSYDGHKGVDFRTRDLVQMRQGVAVLAAADGEVLRLRDGMPDRSMRDENAPKLNGNECGNAVVIGHNGGYETQYCHLKQGSLRVAQGDKVVRGDAIGQIGLSGKTEFPHLHFMLRDSKGGIIDPFAGNMAKSDCDANDYHGHYWQSSAKKAMPYIPTALLNAGVAASAPNGEAVRDGQFRERRLPATAPAIILWADVMGAQKGDMLRLRLSSPDGHELPLCSSSRAKNAPKRANGPTARIAAKSRCCAAVKWCLKRRLHSTFNSMVIPSVKRIIFRCLG
jgi:hypothetical protein